MSVVTAKNIGSLNIEGPSPSFLSKLKSFSLDTFSVPTPPLWVYLILGAIASFVAGYIIYTISQTTAVPKNVRDIVTDQRLLLQDVMSYYYKTRLDVTTLTKSTPKAIGDQVQENENSFINYCPLTVQDAGYLGPVTNGAFAEREAIQMALRAGARCFVLNIDFHDDQSLPLDLFGAPREPRLFYRDTSGTIRSVNSGTVRNVAQALADLSFVGSSSDPLIVVLYIRKIPSSIETPDYLRFLSQIAEQLEPLIPYHLGQTSEGDYHRQMKQNDLFFTPVNRFEKKVILLCNADTSPFRKQKPAYAPNKDLDYLTHVRIYRESTQTFGVTGQPDQNQGAKALIDSVAAYTIIPPDKQKQTIDSTKLRWTLTLSNPGKNPTLQAFTYLQDALGVQSIPLWFFSAERPSASAIDELKKNSKDATTSLTPEAPQKPDGLNMNVPTPTPPAASESEKDELPSIMARYAQCSYRPKPKAIRFVRPSTFTPKQPSTKMDGNQGKLTTPTM
jgi:hypothetical protein